MLAIIQETVKKINSQIHVSWIFSLYITVFCLFVFVIYLNFSKKEENKEVLYKDGISYSNTKITNKSDIFASKNGTTYTFSWCKGADKIKEQNKIFFSSEEEAIKSGRRLSKMCSK